MKKKILLIIFAGTSLFTAFIPSNAEALKVKVKPSISFNQSYSQGYYNPPTRRVVRRNVIRRRYVNRYHYDPYSGVEYFYDPYLERDYDYYHPYEQREYVEYYYPYRSHRSHRRSADFNLKFKFR